MPKSSPTLPRQGLRSRSTRLLTLVGLSVISLGAVALSLTEAPRWTAWTAAPIRILSVDELPTVASVDLTYGAKSSRTISTLSVMERLQLAMSLRGGTRPVYSQPGTHLPGAKPGTGSQWASNPAAHEPGSLRESPFVPGTGSSEPALTVAYRVDTSYVDKNSATYQRFKAFVDQAVAGNPDYGFSASDAAMMYAITKEAKYCNLAVKDTEQQVVDAESAIASGNAPEVAGDSYLYSGDYIGDLSMTYSVCATMLSSSQRTRWGNYAEQTVWNIWNYASAKWGSKTIPWSGWSVDNPGNNYQYSFLAATMSWALAGNSSTWQTFLRTKKLPALKAYFANIPGGGSNEGTGYGTSHMRLFSDYLLWLNGAGEDLASANPHATNSIRYWVHATVPTRDRFVPFGDQARVSVPELYDYQRRLVLEARHLSSDASARDNASWWLSHISVLKMSSGFNTRYDMYPAGTSNTAPAQLQYFAKGTGHLFARTGWDTAAMWVAFIAGPYNESHAHQEQGGFTLFSGDWLAVTENIWSHSGIQQGTETNNVLRFERSGSIVPQVADTTATMVLTPGAGGAFSALADLKPVYGGNAAVGSWKRKVDFAGRKLTVNDTFAVGSGTTATFQVNVPVQPTVSGNVISAGKLRIKVVAPASPTIKLINWKNIDSGEYTKGWRVDISGSSTAYTVEMTDS